MNQHWIAVVLILLLLLLSGGYVGAYFVCSDSMNMRFAVSFRSFPNETTANVFAPMVRVESLIRNLEVMATFPQRGEYLPVVRIPTH